MLRIQTLFWIAALSLTMIMAPDVLAQHRGGSSRGGGRASPARATVHASPAHATVQHASPVHATVHASPAPVHIQPAHIQPAHIQAVPSHAGVIHSNGVNAAGGVQAFNRGAGGAGGYGDRRGFGDRGRGFFGGGLYLGPSIFGSWGWPSFYPNYDDFGYYPPDGSYPPYGNDSPFIPNAGVLGGTDFGSTLPMPQMQDMAAHIDVIVPDANAVVWFDGVQTSSQGTTRHFNTPALQPGGNYAYTIRAAWTQQGQAMSAERVVRVSAGAATVVDFTQPPPQVPIPK